MQLHEVQKVTKRQEDEIAYLKETIACLNRKVTEDLERNMKVAKEKLQLGREKEKKKRDSLAMIQEKEREQTRLRTEKRLEELRFQQIKKEEKQAGLLPE